MSVYQIHRHTIWLGVVGLCLILAFYVDSFRHKTSANWYYGGGVIVAVHHAGSLTLLHSNLTIPWDPEGFNGRVGREIVPVNFEPGRFHFSKDTREGIESHLVEVPYWAMLAAFVSAWSGLLVVDSLLNRSRFQPKLNLSCV